MIPGNGPWIDENESEDDSSSRNEFLLRMYDQLWQSVQRVEGGIWSFVAAFAAIAVSFAAGFQGSVSIFYASIFSIIISFWGMNLSIVSSRWFNRNLIQISNVEKKFLSASDYGSIIPDEYKNPGNRFFNWSSINFYNLNFLAFLSALIVIVSGFFLVAGRTLTLLDQVTVIGIVSVGIIFTYHNYCSSWEHVEAMYRQTAHGKDNIAVQTKGGMMSFLLILSLTFVYMFLLSMIGRTMRSIPSDINSFFIFIVENISYSLTLISLQTLVLATFAIIYYKLLN